MGIAGFGNNSFSSTEGLGGTTVPAVSSKLRFVDMNVASGGVARGTTVTTGAWVQIFSYSGSGLFFGFLVNLQSLSNDWFVRIFIDGNEIFPSGGLRTSDVTLSSLYNLASSNARDSFVGLSAVDEVMRMALPTFPIVYNTSVVIEVIRASSPSKNFVAGAVILTKET